MYTYSYKAKINYKIFEDSFEHPDNDLQTVRREDDFKRIVANKYGVSPDDVSLQWRKKEEKKLSSNIDASSSYNSEKERKQHIKREIAQQKKDDADLDDYLDSLQNNGTGNRKTKTDSFIGSLFSSKEKQDTRTPEQIEADRARASDENRKFLESIKRNWKFILAGLIVVVIIMGVMNYLNGLNVKEANDISLKLEKIEAQIKLAISDGERDKALELVDQLVHPSHEKWEADGKFDALSGYPYYDEWWSKRRQEYKEQVMAMPNTNSSAVSEPINGEISSEQTGAPSQATEEKPVEENVKSSSIVTPKVTLYKVNDPDGYSNLRSTPNGSIIKKVLDTETFEIIASDGKFKKVRLSDGVEGFIHESRIIPSN